MPPLSGVFCVKVECPGHPVYYGVANLGLRPTLDGQGYTLEVHLFDFDGSLYGQILTVIFLHKLRDELKFPSLDALISQINQDVAQAKSYCLVTRSRL